MDRHQNGGSKNETFRETRDSSNTLYGIACSNGTAEFTSKNSGLSDTNVQADISKTNELSDGSGDATASSGGSDMPGSNPESLNPESIGGAGTTSSTDAGAMPPSTTSTTTVASNSEPTSTRPGNSPKESSQTGLPAGKEPLPPAGNSAVSGSTASTPSTTNSEISGGTGDYKKKLEETFKADKESMGSCAPYFQKKLLDAKISGSMNSIATDGKTSMAFKITGNKNKLDINYKNQSNTEVKSTFEGLCIFAACNQSKVVVSVKYVLLKRIFVVARGNKAKIEVKVEGTGDVREIVFDGKGNSPILEVSAPATYPCKDRIKNTGKESGTCKVTP